MGRTSTPVLRYDGPAAVGRAAEAGERQHRAYVELFAVAVDGPALRTGL